MDNYRGMLAYEYLPNVYSHSKIILGMNCDDTSETQTSMRPLEALSSAGGVFISHHTKAMENLFGDYCYLPKNTQETFDMIDEVLSMTDTHRKEFTSKGQKFVYENHNYKLRVEQILKQI
jgi:spore maturation protein CgeB